MFLQGLKNGYRLLPSQTYRSVTSFAKKGKSRAVAAHAASHRSVTPVAFDATVAPSLAYLGSNPDHSRNAHPSGSPRRRRVAGLRG